MTTLEIPPLEMAVTAAEPNGSLGRHELDTVERHCGPGAVA